VALEELGLGQIEEELVLPGKDGPSEVSFKRSLRECGQEHAERRRKALFSPAGKRELRDKATTSSEVPSTPLGDVVRVLTNELQRPPQAARLPQRQASVLPASPAAIADMTHRQLQVRKRPESATSSRASTKGSHMSHQRSRNHRNMSAETSTGKRPKQDWRSIQTRRGADILTAMHERHVQLEAHMRSTSRNVEEDVTLHSNRANSVRQRSTILRNSQLLKEGKDSGTIARLTIVSASGLLPGRRRGGGTADVYCLCFSQKARQYSQQTKVITKTLEPVWEEVLFLAHFPPDEPVVFHIMDELDEELLGQGTLLPSQYYGGFEGQIDLSRPGLRGRPAEPAGHLEIQMKVLYTSS